MRAELETRPRGPMTKAELKRLRREGQVPITVCGSGVEPSHFLAPEHELAQILRRAGNAAMIELRGVGATTLPRNVERHPVTKQLMHVELMRISGREPITAPVRVMLVGEPEASRRNEAVVEHEADTVQVRCLPDRMPAHIDLDVSGMEVGAVLHVSDLPCPQGVEILTPPETVLAVLHTVRALVTPTVEEEPEEAAETAAEPEPKQMAA